MTERNPPLRKPIERDADQISAPPQRQTAVEPGQAAGMDERWQQEPQTAPARLSLLKAEHVHRHRERPHALAKSAATRLGST